MSEGDKLPGRWAPKDETRSSPACSPLAFIHARPDSLPSAVARVQLPVSIVLRHLKCRRCVMLGSLGEYGGILSYRRAGVWANEARGNTFWCPSLTVTLPGVVERLRASLSARLFRLDLRHRLNRLDVTSTSLALKARAETRRACFPLLWNSAEDSGSVRCLGEVQSYSYLMCSRVLVCRYLSGWFPTKSATASESTPAATTAVSTPNKTASPCLGGMFAMRDMFNEGGIFNPNTGSEDPVFFILNYFIFSFSFSFFFTFFFQDFFDFL